ncbi:hypothetical protein P1X14_00560 [Sphingomonas sp. AOB5]|uniref:hypothetical protein n=1 Tax=Sphingomonas sp. AOB5 TaxID=3034017 RepID=UPI0023F63DD4|nr:hypothetical protein [Sphingomonas sp. AOB5]MDF7773723.1 hypothetical protein [Sphingomonas sp. AOB5]
MIGKLLAAFIGNRIDRRDGKGGLKGAIMGVAIERIVRRLGPVGWLLVGIVMLWRLIFGRRRRTRYR